MTSHSRHRQQSLRGPKATSGRYYRPSNGSSRKNDSAFRQWYPLDPPQLPRHSYSPRIPPIYSTPREVYDDEYVEHGDRRYVEEHDDPYQGYEIYPDPYYRQDPYADYEDHRRTTCYDSREDGYAHPRYVQRRSDSDLGGNLRRPFPHGIRTPNASPGHKGQYEPQSSRPEPSRTTIVTKASGEGDDDIPSHILRQVPECEGYELSYSEQTRESTAYVFEKNRDQPGREQGFAVVVNTK